MNKYLDIAPEVKAALDAGKPVVALESTIISHGMPYPQNVETAMNVERIIRDAEFHITVKNPDGKQKGVKQILVDGKPIEGNIINSTPGIHTVEVTM